MTHYRHLSPINTACPLEVGAFEAEDEVAAFKFLSIKETKDAIVIL